MAYNCLETKLNGVISSDAPVFGFITVNIADGEPMCLSIKSSKGSLPLKLEGSVYFMNSDKTGNLGQEITLDGTTFRIAISSGTGKLYIPKYYLNYINLAWGNSSLSTYRFSFDIADFVDYNQDKYQTFVFNGELASIVPEGIYGDISNSNVKALDINLIKLSKITGNVVSLVDSDNTTAIDIRDTDLELNLIDLESCKALTFLAVSETAHGDIASLGKIATLARLSFRSNKQAKSQITGSAADFVTNAIAARQAAGGAGNGTLSLYSPATNFPLVEWPDNAPEGSATLVWDAQGNMSWQ